MNMFLHHHFINNGKRTFIRLRLKQPWKDTNKSFIENRFKLIDKSDNKTQQYFRQGTIKSGILQLMLLLCL
jgi:hypothetical protein